MILTDTGNGVGAHDTSATVTMHRMISNGQSAAKSYLRLLVIEANMDAVQRLDVGRLWQCVGDII